MVDVFEKMRHKVADALEKNKSPERQKEQREDLLKVSGAGVGSFGASDLSGQLPSLHSIPSPPSSFSPSSPSATTSHSGDMTFENQRLPDSKLEFKYSSEDQYKPFSFALDPLPGTQQSTLNDIRLSCDKMSINTSPGHCQIDMQIPGLFSRYNNGDMLLGVSGGNQALWFEQRDSESDRYGIKLRAGEYTFEGQRWSKDMGGRLAHDRFGFVSALHEDDRNEVAAELRYKKFKGIFAIEPEEAQLGFIYTQDQFNLGVLHTRSREGEQRYRFAASTPHSSVATVLGPDGNLEYYTARLDLTKGNAVGFEGYREGMLRTGGMISLFENPKGNASLIGTLTSKPKEPLSGALGIKINLKWGGDVKILSGLDWKESEEFKGFFGLQYERRR